MNAYYLIIESCIRPSGAYSKSLATFPHTHRDNAHNIFALATFTGPAWGMLTSKVVQLVWVDRSAPEATAWVYHVIATRHFA